MKVIATKPIPVTMRFYLSYSDYFALNAGKSVNMKKIPEQLKEYLKKEAKNGDKLQPAQ